MFRFHSMKNKVKWNQELTEIMLEKRKEGSIEEVWNQDFLFMDKQCFSLFVVSNRRYDKSGSGR